MLRQERNIFFALAQRRNIHGHYIEAVIKIFAKGALFQRRAQILIGGSHHAYVDMAGDIAAQALELPLLKHAQQLHLDGCRHVANLIQEDGAGVGLLELARFGGHGAGKGALLVAEQLALHQVFRQRRAIDLHQRPFAPRRVEVNGARDQVLAHAAFAGQQHRGARGRHARDNGENFLHGGAPADNVVERVTPPQFFAKLQVLVPQRAHFKGLLHYRHQVIERKGLQQEIGGARLHGFHRGLDGAESSHDDDGSLRVLAANGAQQLQPIHLRQAQIRQHQIRAVGDLQRFFGSACFLHFETGGCELEFQDAAELLFILDYQDSSLHC